MTAIENRIISIEAKIDALLARFETMPSDGLAAILTNEPRCEELVSQREICDILRISPRTLYRLRKSGELDCKIAKRQIMYLPSEIHRLINGQMILCDASRAQIFYQNYIYDNE